MRFKLLSITAKILFRGNLSLLLSLSLSFPPSLSFTFCLFPSLFLYLSLSVSSLFLSLSHSYLLSYVIYSANLCFFFFGKFTAYTLHNFCIAFYLLFSIHPTTYMYVYNLHVCMHNNSHLINIVQYTLYNIHYTLYIIMYTLLCIHYTYIVHTLCKL